MTQAANSIFASIAATLGAPSAAVASFQIGWAGALAIALAAVLPAVIQEGCKVVITLREIDERRDALRGGYAAAHRNLCRRSNPDGGSP